MEYVLVGLLVMNLVGLVLLWLSQSQIQHEIMELNDLVGGNMRKTRHSTFGVQKERPLDYNALWNREA